jgi:putative hydrolase of the HAD superfamily
VIKKLSKEVDEKGNKKHQIFVLSNMQNEVYEKMKTHKPLKKLFKYIPESNWIISGKIKMIKPNNDIFEYVLNTFNLKVNDCVFIDDQKENIDAAAKLGFKTIQCVANRKIVIKQLEKIAR